MTPLERVLARAEIGDCWTVADSFRYARVSINNVRHYAHRVVYEALVADIPEGMDIDHLCRNRRCVNPDHLEPVTRQINARRGRGSCHDPMHERRADGRCRTCNTERVREYRAREGGSA